MATEKSWPHSGEPELRTDECSFCDKCCQVYAVETAKICAECVAVAAARLATATGVKAFANWLKRPR